MTLAPLLASPVSAAYSEGHEALGQLGQDEPASG